MNPVLLESRQNWIPSNTNPVEGESRQNWIPSKVNPVLNKSRQKWIPSENESRQMWIPPKTNPTRNRYKSQYRRRTLLSWREVESLSYYMKLWRSDPRLRPQTASDGLRGRILGCGLKRPRKSDWGRTALKYEVINWSSFKSRFLTFMASDGLGWPRRSDLRSPVSLHRGRQETLDFSHDNKIALTNGINHS